MDSYSCHTELRPVVFSIFLLEVPNLGSPKPSLNCSVKKLLWMPNPLIKSDLTETYSQGTLEMMAVLQCEFRQLNIQNGTTCISSVFMPAMHLPHRKTLGFDDDAALQQRHAW